MAYQNFIEKLFTKNSTKQDFTWLSIQLTMVCASFQRKLLNFDHIFARDVHLSMANNFSN
jgi:hypothetical protein